MARRRNGGGETASGETSCFVRLCCVFGDSGREVLLVAKDDTVWALGTNKNGCLGNGDTGSCSIPVIVDSLSGKSVRTSAYGGGPHVIALTATGEVYGWGDNSDNQVCRASESQVCTPTLVYSEEDPAAEVACGSRHSAFRTKKGALYCWGSNSCGQVGINSTNFKEDTFRKVGGAIANLECTGISCGSDFTVAVFDGEVYVWGENDSEQLGLGSRTNQRAPVKLSHFNYVVIRKVACGESHTLTLTDGGVLWVWGSNDKGQLGFGNKADQAIPICHSQLWKTFGRIEEIAASQYNSMSAVTTETSKRSRPLVARAPDSLRDRGASSLFSTAQTLDRDHAEKMAKMMAEQFNDPSFSDLKFRVDGKTLHVHKLILKFHCEHFRMMFRGPWAENEDDTVVITEYSYPVYKAFLRYLYTGDAEVPVTEAVELFDLANSKHENDLKAQCQRIIRKGISIDNCARLYMAAVLYNAADLEDFCFRFAMSHATAVEQTVPFEELPEDVLSRLQARAAKHTKN